MLARALIVWFGILAIAFANGMLREAGLTPQLGEQLGRAVSSLILAAAVFVVTWFTIGWIRPVSADDAWIVGLVWVAMTLAFEFLAGHYLFGNPWSRLLAEYNVVEGRIWALVLIATLVAPIVTARAQSLLLSTR